VTQLKRACSTKTKDDVTVDLPSPLEESEHIGFSESGRSVAMVNLRDLIVCPVCHAALSLDDIEVQGSGCCPNCGRRYAFDRGVFDMTPLPPPDEILKSKWHTWEKLQDNGLVSYVKAPELNLSVGFREDAEAFMNFCQSSGLMLDVGCGMHTYPSYLPEGADVVGIDPLAGEKRRAFTFVKGIGEYLPFRDETFDHILYASSLDHIIDPKRSLADAARCVKANGRINLWIDGLSDEEPSTNRTRFGRYQILAQKGFSCLSRHGWFSKMGFRRTLSYVASVASMEVPEGASDCFHFVHLNVPIVFDWLNELNLRVVSQMDYPAADSVFIQVMK